MKKLLFILWFILIPCFAAEDVYQFASPLAQQRFESLTSELRCLVCQNQTIAESNAPLATDLRGQIYQKIQHQQTDKEIIDYLVARYGSYILYQPPLNGTTLALWLGPFIILISSVAYLIYYLRKKVRE